MRILYPNLRPIIKLSFCQFSRKFLFCRVQFPRMIKIIVYGQVDSFGGKAEFSDDWKLITVTRPLSFEKSYFGFTRI